jgi:hypothetical protein
VLVFHEYVWGKIEVSNLKTWHLNDMSNSDVFKINTIINCFIHWKSMQILCLSEIFMNKSSI